MINRESLIDTTKKNKKPSIDLKERMEIFSREILELCQSTAEQGQSVYVAMGLEAIKTGICIGILQEKYDLEVESDGPVYFISWNEETKEKEENNATT